MYTLKDIDAPGQGGPKLQTSFLLSEKNYIKNWFTSWIKRQKKTEVYLLNKKLISYFAFLHKMSVFR